MHRPYLLLAAFLLLPACGHRHQREDNNAQPTGPRQATVQYFGHGCFRVSSSIGLSVVIDPFNPAVLTYRVKPASIQADVVLITHEDETADDVDLVAGSPQTFRSSVAVGVDRASGILVRGVRTSSENYGASNRLNVAYVWSMDGVRFCHLGAIEDALTLSEALNIGTVDVLFLPVGGPPAFTEDKRRQTVARLKPRIIVPMMYATSASGKVPLRPLGEWLAHQTNVVRINGNQFSVSRAALPATATTYVLTAR
ncbi:MAG: MBL fold metallo-hydrolase [Verrucomicrobia bacterium]|nr:MBL fold metallo-hydrolase [Verrucomicrobiota bacterium]